MTWKRGEFEIESWMDGFQRTKVKGFVLAGVFGVHRAGKRKTYYPVTHLPTGAAVSPSGSFGRQLTAKRYAERILPLADWKAVTKQSAPQQIDGKLLVAVADGCIAEGAA